MKLFLTLAAVSMLAAIPVSRAGAADPPPTPCKGIITTDPAGDDTVQPLAVPVSGAHSAVGENPNIDIRNVYFNYRPNAAGEKVLTGYLTVKNLSKAVPEGAPDDVTWWVEFDRFENGVSSLKATSDGTEVKFFYGTQDQFGVLNAPPEYTETTGQFIEGADGVVAIDLPAAAGLKTGDKLTGVYGMTTYNSSSTDRGSRTFADRAPDDGAAAEKTYTLTECPAPAAAPAAEPQPQGSPPQETPSGTQPAQPSPGEGQPAQPAKPGNTTAQKRKQCAAKAKKKFKGKKNAKKRKAALKKCKKIR